MTVTKPVRTAQIVRNFIRSWQELVELNVNRARKLHDDGFPEVARVIGLSIDGGDCIRCGVAYTPIQVANMFAEYTYYQPSCKCWPVCWHCRTIIVEGKIIDDGIERCPNCKVHLWYTPHYMPEAWMEEKLNEAAKGLSIQYNDAYQGER